MDWQLRFLRESANTISKDQIASILGQSNYRLFQGGFYGCHVNVIYDAWSYVLCRMRWWWRYCVH
jgi:hypothetical protein